MADQTAEGIQAAGVLANDARKALAYNALARAYGPVAGDPEGALKLQDFTQKQITNPTEAEQGKANLTSTNLSNTAAQSQYSREQGYRAAGQLIAAAGADGSVPGDLFDQTIGAHPTQYGMDPTLVAAFRAKATAPGGSQFMSNIQRQLIGPTTATGQPIVAQGPNGQSVLLTHDKYGNITQNGLAPGVVPVTQQRSNQGQENADTSRAGLPIRKQNADTAAFNAGVRANNSVYGAPGGAPGPGTGAPAAQSGQPAPSAIDQLPPKGQTQVRGQAQQIVNNQTNFDNAMTIAASMQKQISPYTTGAGALLKSLPGSLQNDLRANAETLRAQAAQAVLSGSKNAQGNTGFGRILQAEYKNFTNMYGNLEQDQSAKQYAFHLQLLQQSLAKIQSAQRSNFTGQWKVSPEAAIGQPERGAGPLPQGWKYLGVAK